MTALDPSREQTPPSPTKHSGQGHSKRVAGLHVVNLKGSYYEMGHQHGSLLAKEILEGPLPYYRPISEKFLRPVDFEGPRR